MPSLPLLRNSSHLSVDMSTTWEYAGGAANIAAAIKACAIRAWRNFMRSILVAARSNPLGLAKASASLRRVPVRPHRPVHVRERAVGQLGDEEARGIDRTRHGHPPLRDALEARLLVVRLVADQDDEAMA